MKRVVWLTSFNKVPRKVRIERFRGRIAVPKKDADDYIEKFFETSEEIGDSALYGNWDEVLAGLKKSIRLVKTIKKKLKEEKDES